MNDDSSGSSDDSSGKESGKRRDCRKSSHLNKFGARFSIGFDISSRPAMRWDKSNNRNRNCHPQDVIDFCCEAVLPLLQFEPNVQRAVTGFTELRVKKGTQQVTQIYRAHPCFQAIAGQTSDVWYDWATFAVHNGEERPCHIMCFLDFDDLLPSGTQDVNGYSIKPGNTYCIVRMLKEKPQPIRGSLTGDENHYSSLVQWAELHDSFHLFPTSAIVKPAIVVPNIKEVDGLDFPKNHKHDQVDPKGGYFVIAPRHEWADHFTEVVMMNSRISRYVDEEDEEEQVED